MRNLFGKCDLAVLSAVVVSVAALCAIAMIAGDGMTAVTGVVMKTLYEQCDWALALYALASVVFLVFVSLSKWGGKKLGSDESAPEYSTFTWAAMLVCCGLAVGVFFWSVAEPLHHYMNTPYLAESQTAEAISVSLGIVDFDWGISIWALYAVVGLAIGIAAYRFDAGFSFGSAFSGLSLKGGGRGVARMLNYICSLFTVLGLSVSLGMGVLSISYGIADVLGLDCGIATDIAVMCVIGIIFTISSILGLKRGMARLSNAAVFLAIGLLLFVLFFGPTSFILRAAVESFGVYLQYFPTMALFTDPGGQTDGWPLTWTLFYYAWALSWTPYVGGFFAKVSKGRTVRQFCLGTMILPAVACIVWFDVIGGASIGLYLDGVTELWTAVQAQTEAGFFVLLEQLPLPAITGIVVLIDLVLFMTTSCDGAVNYVTLALSNGAEPKNGLKIVVSVMVVACPIALIVGGGLETIKNVALIMGPPFIVFGIMSMVSAVRMLEEPEVCQNRLFSTS